MSAVVLEPLPCPAVAVLVTRADGAYRIEAWPDPLSTVVSCPDLGVIVTLTAAERRDVGAGLMRAAEAIESGRWAIRHLRPMGSWHLPVLGLGPQQVDLDAVRDDAEHVKGVLISMDGLALDGYLDASAARELGAALLAAD